MAGVPPDLQVLCVISPDHQVLCDASYYNCEKKKKKECYLAQLAHYSAVS